MKLIELQAYRTFMFAVVPQLFHEYSTIEEAITEAQNLWDAIDAHVLGVAKELENA